MASIIKSGYEDLAAMTAILESAIIEASNDPKSSKPTVRTDRESKLEKQLAAVTATIGAITLAKLAPKPNTPF